MKTYKVTMIEKDYPNFQTSLQVNTDNLEHPSQRAIELYCKLGYNIKKEKLRVIKTERII